MITGELQSKLISSEVVSILETCCAQRVHVVVASPFSGSAVTGNFRRLRGGAVTFDIRGPVTQLFEKLTSAVVSFAINDTLHVFVGAVVSHLSGSLSGTLIVTVPPFMLQPDLRQSFRVPLINPGRLRVQLEAQGYAVLEPKILDLSDGGMLIEFPEDPGLDLTAGHPIRLQLDEDNACFVAEVRHNHSGRYGMKFLDSLNALDPLREKEALQNIVTQMKELWLSREP